MVIDRDSWEKVQNDLEVIKARVSSLDRIAVLENKDIIIADLRSLIGNSTYKAAVLHLAREEISRPSLVEALGTDEKNLNKFVAPLTGNKGYLYEFRHRGRVSYMRDEKLELIGFDDIDPFASLIERWKTERAKAG